MSTSHSIIFFSYEITPTIQKMIDFVRKEPHGRKESDEILGEYEYFPTQSVWIHLRGEGFEYFGLEEYYKPEYKNFKTFIHIGASNATYGKKRYSYNYPYFHKLMEHIKDDYVGDIYLMCTRNESKQRPKWMKEWKGKIL